MSNPALNDEDFIPMPREEFDRLPMDVQAATLEKIRQQRRFRGDCVESRDHRKRRAILYGAFSSGVIAPLIGPNWICFGVMLVIGAFWGYFFVAKQINHLVGIVCFGSGAIVATLFVGGGNMLVVFSGWVIYCVAGALLSLWATSHVQVNTKPSPP